jgi:hypothetical protein
MVENPITGPESGFLDRGDVGCVSIADFVICFRDHIESTTLHLQ